MSAQNIHIIRHGKNEISTAVEHGYGEVLIRKGPNAIDSTITLSVDEALTLIGSLKSQVRILGYGL